MNCDRKTICHATAAVVLPGKTHVTMLMCFHPIDAHPFIAETGETVHVDDIVGVAFP